MTSLLLLLLGTAMVQVLLRPSVVGAATGVFQDKAGDVDVCKAKTCNDIKNKNTEKQKKICKENKEVRFSCPQTCDDVSVFKKECPSKITSSKFEQEKDCSKKYQHNRQCDYDYKYTGCTWDELQCTSQQGYTCDYESSSWNLATTIIEQCENPPNDPVNYFPFDEECTPCSDVPAEGCPTKAPTNQEECSDFENGLTCEYNFMLTGCTRNELQCSPTSYFTCEQEYGWLQMDALYAPCPAECPSTYKSSTFQDDCSEKYQHNRQCNFDYRYTGCTWDELQCTSLQGYTCDYESSTWLWETTNTQECENPPNDLPVNGDCTPCSDVPAEGCPEIAPTHQEECSDFENGLLCEYNFMLTGCTPNELQCSPISYFTCEQDQLWQEWADSPVRCPSDKCPTNSSSSDFGMPCEPDTDFQDGLECQYGYVFTGCTEEALNCSPEETYSCDYEVQSWLLATVDRQECDPRPIDLPVSQQCAWPEVLDMRYEAAERIIRASDPVGFLTDIVMLVDGGSYTEDYSYHRVRVFVKNNTDIVVAIPMVG